MVRQIYFVAPGDLATPTGGFVYDRRIVLELTRLGRRVDVVNLGEGFPWPSPAQRKSAEARLAAIPSGAPIVVDGLALGALPDLAARLRIRHPLIALVHHPLALETGVSPSQAAQLSASERAALASADEIITTSQTTADLLAAEYGVEAARIHVARPGNDPSPMGTGGGDGLVGLLAVGSVTPRKGFDVLIAALAELAELPWRLVIAGALDRDPDCATRLFNDIRRRRLEARVTMLGPVSTERLEQLYLAADVFVLASRYEGYGMAFSEAISHGLPVVGTTGGAIPEAVPVRAGALAPPGDIEALRKILRRIIEDPGERGRLAAGAREAARNLPRWSDAAGTFIRAIERAAIK